MSGDGAIASLGAFKQADTCALVPPEHRARCLPQSLVCGFLDSRTGGGQCVAVATTDGHLFIARRGRKYAEASGLGAVRCVAVVEFPQHDVLLVVGAEHMTVVDARGGVPWCSRLLVAGLAEGARCVCVCAAYPGGYFLAAVGACKLLGATQRDLLTRRTRLRDWPRGAVRHHVR